MKTKCKIFTKEQKKQIFTMELDLTQYRVLFLNMNEKEVVGFRISDLLIAVPVSFLS